MITPRLTFSDYTPVRNRPASVDTGYLVAQLGHGFFVGPDNLARFNGPLIAAIVSQGPGVLPILERFLANALTVPQVVEGLFTAQCLADSGVNVDSLYGTVSRFNQVQDPFVQIYLAGLYRKMEEPATFGPMFRTLLQTSATAPGYTPLPSARPLMLDTAEEIGGTVLQKIANATAKAMRGEWQAGFSPELLEDLAERVARKTAYFTAKEVIREMLRERNALPGKEASESPGERLNASPFSSRVNQIG